MRDKNDFSDLKDSQRDRERLQPDEATFDLPDVKDIPGQENIHVPKLREMADTTISSDDEEGVGIWDNDESFEDLTSEKFGPAHQISADDLNTEKLESEIEEEDILKDGNDDNSLNITDDSADSEADVTPGEKKILELGSDNMDTLDNETLFRSKLDDTDFDGEKLNEEISVTGEDLDIPGTEDDDANEEIGEEDEENNAYSWGDTE